MFLLQSLGLMVLWLGYGFVQWRRSAELRERILAIPRGKRVGLGLLLMVGGAAVLLFGLFFVQSMGGTGQGGFKLWAVAAIGGIGLVFVHMQTLAGAMMMTLIQESVTSGFGPPSTKVESDEQRKP